MQIISNLSQHLLKTILSKYNSVFKELTHEAVVNLRVFVFRRKDSETLKEALKPFLHTSTIDNIIENADGEYYIVFVDNRMLSLERPEGENEPLGKSFKRVKTPKWVKDLAAGVLNV